MQYFPPEWGIYRKNGIKLGGSIHGGCGDYRRGPRGADGGDLCKPRRDCLLYTSMLSLLERRLDNVVYRMGIGESRAQARQFVLHGHILVNGKKVDIPSYRVNVGDQIAVKEKSASLEKFKAIAEQATRPMPKWLEFDPTKLSGAVTAIPERDDIDLTVEEHLIVELYSK